MLNVRYTLIAPNPKFGQSGAGQHYFANAEALVEAIRKHLAEGVVFVVTGIEERR